MTIKSGWEVSPDREGMFQKILEEDDVGEPIITSKCKLDRENGFLVVSENGFAWRLKFTYSTSVMSAGKSKWVRWHDVADFVPKKDGVLLTYVKVRKKGELKLNKKGEPKVTKWKLTIQRNKNEEKSHFRERQAEFNGLMMELFNKYKVDADPPTSDSRI